MSIPVPVNFDQLISDMEVDLMVLGIQKESGFADRYRMALMLLKTIGPAQLSELSRLKELISPILSGDLYVMTPISLSWVNDGNKSRMREAIAGSIKFRESLRQVISIEGSLPNAKHLSDWS